MKKSSNQVGRKRRPMFSVQTQTETRHSKPKAKKIKTGDGVVRPEEEVMELLWQNGQVVMKSQRSSRMPDDNHLIPGAAFPCASPAPAGDPPLQLQQEDAYNNNHHLFIQEDEMSSWLLSDLSSGLPFPAPTSSVPSHPPPAAPPPKRSDSFGHFSRAAVTVMDSSDTPMVTMAANYAAQVVAQSTSPVVRVAATHDRTATSSSGATSASAEPIPPGKSQEVGPPQTEAHAQNERTRKSAGGERKNNGEAVRLVSNHAKRVLRASSSNKRSRAAEVHNLSERRRRDRINEKMRALQELIPHCNKANKAPMLDEAIGYLKSLQMQVQMMSMGCGMMPMMYPGMQHYMPHMGVGMNRPMIHFPNTFHSSMPPTTATGPHMGPGFRFPAFQMPQHIPAPDPSRIPPTNQQPDATLSSLSLQTSNSPRTLGFIDPYQQFFGLQQMHLPFQQSKANTSGSGKPTTSKVGETLQKESPD